MNPILLIAGGALLIAGAILGLNEKRPGEKPAPVLEEKIDDEKYGDADSLRNSSSGGNGTIRESESVADDSTSLGLDQ